MGGNIAVICSLGILIIAERLGRSSGQSLKVVLIAACFRQAIMVRSRASAIISNCSACSTR